MHFKVCSTVFTVTKLNIHFDEQFSAAPSKNNILSKCGSLFHAHSVSCRCADPNSFPASGDFCGLLITFANSHYENMPIQNILKILPQKNENFQRKNSDIFHFSAQNIDCGYSLEPPRRGGSNEYPRSMFLSRNKKNNVYPYKPQFYYIKVGFKGVKII